MTKDGSVGSRCVQLWNRVLKRLKSRHQGVGVEVYLSTVSPHLDEDGGRMRLVVPNSFVADNIDKRYGLEIRELLAELGSVNDVEIVVEESPEAQRNVSSEGAPADGAGASVAAAPQGGGSAAVESVGCELNPRYTFENLVVGDSNEFAYRVARAVVAAPGVTYNPLFIYGGVGLGKTHIMQAIAHELLGRPGKPPRVMYVTSEYFINDFISTIELKDYRTFREKYRGIDILLIDDVQFFSGKEKTQEEFFHTFNTLYEARKQIVMTSDRPPGQLEGITQRLVSRFECGVVVDVKEPSLEMRMAILKNMATQSGISIPLDAISYIAERIEGNVRRLQGAFTKVVAFASMTGAQVTRSMIEEVLGGDLEPARPRQITLDLIKEKVCEFYGLKPSELVGPSKQRRYVIPRQVAMYLAHELTGETLVNIGRGFGRKDHTTVLHACERIKEELRKDSAVAQDVKLLKIRLRETVK